MLVLYTVTGCSVCSRAGPCHALTTGSRAASYMGPVPALHAELACAVQGLGVTLGDGTSVLDSVTGRFSHSRIAAVMGPSGAGKSTLLYALMGTARYGRTTGRVWVNTRAIPLQRLRRIVGYVPQVRALTDKAGAWAAWRRDAWPVGAAGACLCPCMRICSSALP